LGLIRTLLIVCVFFLGPSCDAQTSMASGPELRPCVTVVGHCAPRFGMYKGVAHMNVTSLFVEDQQLNQMIEGTA